MVFTILKYADTILRVHPARRLYFSFFLHKKLGFQTASY